MEPAAPCGVIVTAAGRGERMGADKALLDLGGTTAIERIVAQCRAAGLGHVVVVRSRSAAPLPDLGAGVHVVVTEPGLDMANSVRAGAQALPAEVARVLVFPVDHALVMADTLAALAARLLEPGVAVCLPLWRERVGHPAAFLRTALAELDRPGATLRDVVHADRARVRVVPTANPWVCADLDHPEDLRAARAHLAAGPHGVVEQMHRHRSIRAYRPDPLAAGQLERLVDAARRASTSSFIQAYAVVAVEDPERRAAVAALCGSQQHIVQAPLFAAVCADLHKLALCAERAGGVVQAQSLELFLQSTVDAALLGQNLQLAAESEGLGACMIGAARNHPLQLAQLLGLPRHVYVVYGMTIGHPAEQPLDRGRMPLDAVLHRERYDEAAIPAALARADDDMRAWARKSNAALAPGERPIDEAKGWTDRMAVLWGSASRYVKARAALREELRQLGFALE